jgi:hypothetical protein
MENFLNIQIGRLSGRGLRGVEVITTPNTNRLSVRPASRSDQIRVVAEIAKFLRRTMDVGKIKFSPDHMKARVVCGYPSSLSSGPGACDTRWMDEVPLCTG